MECRRFSQTTASEWQTAFVVSHKMPWCALLTAVKNYNKSLEKLLNFFFKTETKTKTKCSRPRTRPRLHDPRPRLIFVLEAPRDQDPGVKDYITALKTTGGILDWLCSIRLSLDMWPLIWIRLVW